MLKRKNLGNTGMEVSEFCFGALPFGALQANVSKQECVRLLLKAIELGVNFFDTAELYRTQEFVGAALREAKGEAAIVATKSTATDYKGMQASIENSLRELQRDYIDIYHLHAARVGKEVFKDREGALQCLLDYRDRGYLRAVGVSTHSVTATLAAAEQAEIDVVFPIINQAGMGIINGTLAEMLAAIEKVAEAGKGVYAMKALAGGNLIEQAVAAINYVRAIPGISAVAVGVVNEAELLYDYEIFAGQITADDQEASLERTKPKQIFVSHFCKGCGQCVETCPNGALRLVEGKATVDHALCLRCGYCSPSCPEFAIRLI